MEPFTAAHDALSGAELRDLLSVADIFSPNLGEAASMLGREREPTSDRCLHLSAAGKVGLYTTDPTG